MRHSGIVATVKSSGAFLEQEVTQKASSIATLFFQNVVSLMQKKDQFKGKLRARDFNLKKRINDDTSMAENENSVARSRCISAKITSFKSD